MNRKLLLSLFALLPLASGCVVFGGGGSIGDVTFTWSFQGKSCAQVPDVAKVYIQIPGETLESSGVYPCTSSGYPGIVLHNFLPGTYSFTIGAYDTYNTLLYTKTGSFIVDGDVTVTVDLTPVAGTPSYAYLSWRFPSNSASTNPTCAQAGVSTVSVQIDSGTATTYNCTEGFGSPGRQTSLLAPGAHSIWLGAYDSTGYLLYSYTGTLTITSGTPTSQEYNLAWAVGGMVLKWQLTADNGVTTRTCTQAGVNNLYVNFEDLATGTMLYGLRADPTTWDPQSCNLTSVVYGYLPPGAYKIYVTGAGSSGAYYSANYSTPAASTPSVTITAGVFPTEAQAISVMLYWSP